LMKESMTDQLTILEHGRKVAKFGKGDASAEDIIEIIRSGHQAATEGKGEG